MENPTLDSSLPVVFPQDPGPPETEEVAGSPPPEESAENKIRSEDQSVPQGRLVMRIALQNGELFLDERNEAWARVRVGPGMRVLALRSRDYQQWLEALVYRQTKMSLSEQTTKAVVRVLCSEAVEKGRVCSLYVRFARAGGEVDLAPRNRSNRLRIWGPERGGHEGKAVYGGADHRGAQGG